MIEKRSRARVLVYNNNSLKTSKSFTRVLFVTGCLVFISFFFFFCSSCMYKRREKECRGYIQSHLISFQEVFAFAHAHTNSEYTNVVYFTVGRTATAIAFQINKTARLACCWETGSFCYLPIYTCTDRGTNYY